MNTRTQRNNGFTLVEILIVVVILGILAAIVIPQFTNASESARATSLVQQLQTIRGQLELYQVQHTGNYPNLTGDDGWDQMTQTTDVAGDTENDGFGPYLQQAPINPFTNSSTVAAEAADGVGWVWDATNGTIIAVLPETAAPDDLGLNATDYTQLGGDDAG